MYRPYYLFLVFIQIMCIKIRLRKEGKEVSTRRNNRKILTVEPIEDHAPRDPQLGNSPKKKTALVSQAQ